jgi:DNA-binding response OmpR family regulator
MTHPRIAIVAEKDPVLGEAIADSLEVLGFDPIIAPSEKVADTVMEAVGEPDLMVCDADFGAAPRPYAFVRSTLAKAPYLPMLIASTPRSPVPRDLEGRIAIAEKPFGKAELVKGVKHAEELVAGDETRDTSDK